MTVYTNGEDIFIFTTDLHADPIAIFEKENKPTNLTDEEKKSEVNRDIKKRGDKAIREESQVTKVKPQETVQLSV